MPGQVAVMSALRLLLRGTETVEIGRIEGAPVRPEGREIRVRSRRGDQVPLLMLLLPPVSLPLPFSLSLSPVHIYCILFSLAFYYLFVDYIDPCL